MIEPRELRKGNFVKCLVHLPIGFYKPKLSYSEIIELRSSEVETTEGFHKYKDIGPIQLTEEVLLKCGGTKITDDRFILKSYNNEIEDIIVIVDSTNFYLGDNKNNKFSTSIESLHHLQNLFFDLTNTELNIEKDE